jgi:hypothetical protein
MRLVIAVLCSTDTALHAMAQPLRIPWRQERELTTKAWKEDKSRE